MESLKQEEIQASLGQSSQTSLGLLGASFLYISAGIGAMITIVPYCWLYQGFILGMISLMTGFAFILQAGYQYVKLAVATSAYSLEDLTNAIIGPKCSLLANIIQILCQGILIISALYVAANSLSGLLSEITNSLHKTWLSSPLCTVYIYLALCPLFFKREIKEMKLAGLILIISTILLVLLEAIYFIQNASHIRKLNRNHKFNFPLLPHRPNIRAISAALVIFMAPGFTQVSLPIIKSMGSVSITKGFRPMVLASIYLFVYYIVISVISIALFGQLLLNHDTLIKVIYYNSHSVTASLIQVMSIFFTVFHTPVLIFTMRESLLLFVYSNWQSTHRPESAPHQDQTDALLSSRPSFPIMYERVTHCTFYSVTFSIFVSLLLINLLLRNLIKFIEICLIPCFALTTIIFPNLLAIRYYGYKAEKLALVFLILMSIISVASTVIAILNFNSK